MNRVFKNVWSHIHQQYVVTNEQHASRGKVSKSAVAVAIVGALMAGSASAAYQDPGKIGDVESWKTAEYLKSWGHEVMHAATAYALGYTGKGAVVGVMDSGIEANHQEFKGDRIRLTHVTGTLGQSGDRSPHLILDPEETSVPYKKGDAFDVTGQFNPAYNDSHGTHVSGIIAANRDGQQMHGVAFDTTLVVGNTGGNDKTNYGPYQDYEFFRKGWQAIVDSGARVINNSWGTNDRVKVRYELNDDGTPTIEDGNPIAIDPDAKHSDQLCVDTIRQAEYEFFNFKKTYGDNPSFIDAAYEAVKDVDAVQVFTTGNRMFTEPYYRGLYPYFHPEAEKNWIAVAGLEQKWEYKKDKNDEVIKTPIVDANGDTIMIDGEEGPEAFLGNTVIQSEGKYQLVNKWNEAGDAKWWTVTSPGKYIYSTVADPHENGRRYLFPKGDALYNGKLELCMNPGFLTDTNTDDYSVWSGTSMAAPNTTGAMAVLLSRYPAMKATQVRDVMFTTANHKLANGKKNMNRWKNHDKSTPKDGEVSDRMGWGVPDLAKGMYGPGQFLGVFDYDLSAVALDVWTNDISQVALEQRKREDQQWMKTTENGTKLDADTYELGDGFILNDGDEDDANHKIDPEQAKAWRAEYYQARANAITHKLENNLYNGTLIKRGEGTLVMTGNNTYAGGTTVKAGTLHGFTQSFGDAPVVVEGGHFGLLTQYNDEFTQKGELTDGDHAAQANVILKKGGTLDIVAGQDAKLKDLSIEDGAKVALVSAEGENLLAKALKGEKIDAALSFETVEKFEEAKPAVLAAAAEADAPKLEGVDNAFVKTDASIDTDAKKVNVSMSKKTDQEVAQAASNADEAAVMTAVAKAVAADTKGAAAQLYGAMTTAQLAKVASHAADDLVQNAQTAAIMNADSVTQTVLSVANGFGSARTADVDGLNLWATGVANRGTLDAKHGNDVKTDFGMAIVGLDKEVAPNTRVGGYFGAGHTSSKGDIDGKVTSTDLMLGMYANSQVTDAVKLTGGASYMHMNRELKRDGTADADGAVFQLFGQVAYTGLSTEQFDIEPYAGLSWIHANADGIHTTQSTELESQNLGVTTLGVRAAVPFTVSSFAMKAKVDAGWKHFMGDNTATADVALPAVPSVSIEGQELKDLGTIELGVDAQLTKATTLGVSYMGAFGSDVKSNGAKVQFTYRF